MSLLYLAVHRLDRLTSGLLMFAKTVSKAQQLEVEIRERKVTKIYVCRVKGEFPRCATNIHVRLYFKRACVLLCVKFLSVIWASFSVNCMQWARGLQWANTGCVSQTGCVSCWSLRQGVLHSIHTPFIQWKIQCYSMYVGRTYCIHKITVTKTLISTRFAQNWPDASNTCSSTMAG